MPPLHTVTVTRLNLIEGTCTLVGHASTERAGSGGLILEADTDGIYLSSEKYYADPDALLGLVADAIVRTLERYLLVWRRGFQGA